MLCDCSCILAYMHWCDKQFVAGTTQSLSNISAFPNSPRAFLGMIWNLDVLCLCSVFLTAFPAEDLESIEFRSTDTRVCPFAAEPPSSSWTMGIENILRLPESFCFLTSVLKLKCPRLLSICIVSRNILGAFFANLSIILKSMTLCHLYLKLPCASRGWNGE